MQLHVHEWGDPGAPEVVCLHGVQAHGRRFRRLAEERLSRRFHVLAPDLRGHGRSGWDGPWTLEAHAADFVETFTQPAAWIGHSFGGRLVAELIARRPQLVQRAVMLDPALVVPLDHGEMLAQQELAFDASFGTVEEAVESKFVSVGEAHRYQFSLGELFHLVVVPGGHSVLWDAFDETADAIEAFLS